MAAHAMRTRRRWWVILPVAALLPAAATWVALPPSFLSAGNGDPLAPHSQALVDALQAQGVAVDALCFPDDHVPALPHEYPFNLDVATGREALARSLAFLEKVATARSPGGSSEASDQ